MRIYTVRTAESDHDGEDSGALYEIQHAFGSKRDALRFFTKITRVLQTKIKDDWHEHAAERNGYGGTSMNATVELFKTETPKNLTPKQTAIGIMSHGVYFGSWEVIKTWEARTDWPSPVKKWHDPDECY
tara:strand:+ start:705 stop:1091 length:387 start_codon:yes stop_codon:yes gene_type:complete